MLDLCSRYKNGNSALLTLSRVLHFTARDALYSKSKRFLGAVKALCGLSLF